MRRLVGWAAGLVSIAALARLLGRRHATHPQVEPDPDHAAELRRKLDEARAADLSHADVPTDVARPSGSDANEAPATTIEERRARVHAKAREATDAMRSADP